jgi:hypothetical protein
MMTQYEQFLDMLADVKQVHPRVYGSKNIRLVHDRDYEVVEVSSSAGCLLLGFSKKTGELRDIIGPMPLPRQGHSPHVLAIYAQSDAKPLRILRSCITRSFPQLGPLGPRSISKHE